MPKRACGDCQLCCKLLPTPEIGSLANERCKHQKHGVGCAIYDHRPMSCRYWNCGWLQDGSDLPRPDRSHYVIDTMPDYITVVPHDGGEPQHRGVIQVWVDPLYPDAHKAPSFRRWLDAQAMPAIIRYNAKDGFLLAPPSITGGDGWIEKTTGMREHSHTLEQTVAALGGEMRIEAVVEGEKGLFKIAMTIDGETHTVAAEQTWDRERARASLADAANMRRQRKEAS